MTRWAVALCALVLSGPAVADAQTSPAITTADLRARLELLSSDSMRQRRAGSPEHDRAARYLVSESERIGVSPGVNGRTFDQLVPLRRRQFAPEESGFRLSVEPAAVATAEQRRNMRMPPGLAFLPLTGEFGLDLPWRGSASERANAFVELVYGGQLGQPDAISPAAAAGRVVAFMPPLRPNGQPDYQLQLWAEELRRYRASAAIFLATYDLMPRSVFRRLTEPQYTLDDGRRRPAGALPPVVAIPRGVAEAIADYRSASFHFTFRDIAFEHPPRNVIGLVQGSDPELRAEFVVLTASLDGSDGSGAAALMEIAEHVAALPSKPKRSVLFVWTTARDVGMLGAEHFIANSGVAAGKVVATVTLDRIAGDAGVRADETVTLELRSGSTRSSALGGWIDSTRSRVAPEVALANFPPVCDGEESVFARLGAPAVRLTRFALSRGEADSMKVDWAGFTRIVQLAAAIVVDVADRRGIAVRARAEPLGEPGCGVK